MDLFTLILGRNISGGSGTGGVKYSSIVYNEDNTVTLTEKDGTTHTMACTYENGKLIGVIYDGEAVDLAYADDLLLSISGTSVDMSKAPATSDVFVITASGAISNCTVDKPYIEILSAAQAGKTIILLFPKPFSTEYWILSPYRINNDRSGTFRCITPSDIEYEGDSEYLLFVTIYPDNTVQARQERFIKELDHRITFKADGQDYQIITVKDGQSVLAPSPNPTSESGTFSSWLNALSGESVTFPLTPTEDLWLNAKFSTVRTEMEWNESGFWLRNDGYDYQKVNNAKTLGGTAFTRYSGTYRYYIVMVGETMEAVQTNPSITVSNLEYDGRTYYYVSQYTMDKSATNSYNFTPNNTPSYASAEAVAKATLDRYFYKTD